MKKLVFLLLPTLFLSLNLIAQVNIIPFGSTWSYLDDGSNQGIGWRTAFEGKWKTGNGMFGYGIKKDVVTELSYGPGRKDKYITTYFARSFTLTDLGDYISYVGKIKSDDGALVYLNGVEVYRTNMPSGPINYLTLAQKPGDRGKTAESFTINTSALRSGANVLAVEIHQKSEKDPDAAFDFALQGVQKPPADQTAPWVSSVNRLTPATEATTSTTLTYQVTFSESVSGVDASDFSVTNINGTVNGTVTSVSAVTGSDGSKYDVLIAATGTGEVRLDLVANNTGIVDVAGNAITGGYITGQFYIIQLADQTSPTVSSINRLTPSTQTTTSIVLTYQVTFTESVSGVNSSDFTVTKVSGTVSGSIGSITAVTGSNGSKYDVVVDATGIGDVRLELNASNTGIVDAFGNPVSGGYSDGQVYSIISGTPNAGTLTGFKTVTYLTALSITSHTGQKPQAKTWSYAGKWWAVLATSNGTEILRLDGTAWTSILKLSGAGNSKCDVRVVGNLAHILLFRGASNVSYVASVQYNSVTEAYELWSQRSSLVNIQFEQGTETATLDVDSRGRMWIASDGETDIRVRWSDAPYSSWSEPFILAAGVTTDDICSITSLNDGKIGVFWSNQTTKFFGFSTHTDGDSPDAWSADELPDHTSALDLGLGMADDHMNLMLASDGTLYCAVKTGYDTPGFAKVSLLVRRPSGSWDHIYPVTTDMIGTRPIVILNEAVGKLKIIYTSSEQGGDILYKEAFLSDLSTFSEQFTLFSGNYNYVTSTHQTYNPEIVVVATDESLITDLKAVGFIGSDAATSANTRIASSAPSTPNEVIDKGLTEESAKGNLQVFPNPFSGTATVSFTPSVTGPYTIALYDLKGAQISVIKQGWAEGGKMQQTQLNRSNLINGMYLLRLQTIGGTKTVKLLSNE